MLEANCRFLPPDKLNMPFGDTQDEEEEFDDDAARDFADQYCRSCPALTKCKEWAREVGVSHGVYGGERTVYRPPAEDHGDYLSTRRPE